MPLAHKFSYSPLYPALSTVWGPVAGACARAWAGKEHEECRVRHAKLHAMSRVCHKKHSCQRWQGLLLPQGMEPNDGCTYEVQLEDFCWWYKYDKRARRFSEYVPRVGETPHLVYHEATENLFEMYC